LYQQLFLHNPLVNPKKVDVGPSISNLYRHIPCTIEQQIGAVAVGSAAAKDTLSRSRRKGKMKLEKTSQAHQAASPAGRLRLPAEGGPRDSLYLQVANALKDEIVSGVFPIGSLLPTENELCARFSVSRNTVREALRRLREEGLISSRRGAGSTVEPPRASPAYAQDVNSINDLLARASNTHMDIEFAGMVTIDRPLSLRTGLAPGDEWLAVRGIGYSDDSELPVCWAEYYINRDFAGIGRLIHHQIGPIVPLLESLFGARIEEVSQEIAGTLISAQLARSLKVKVHSAALEVRRRFTLADGKIAQVTTSVYPASRYRHSMTIRRTKS
jgi:GntR family transcriptional regulator